MPPGMQEVVTRPLPARLMLLAAAAALAASLVFAIIVAEHRDGDRRPVNRSAAPELRVDAVRAAPRHDLEALSVSAR